jgi:hypothetical protein
MVMMMKVVRVLAMAALASSQSLDGHFVKISFALLISWNVYEALALVVGQCLCILVVFG